MLYLLGWLLALPTWLIIPYVYAQDCDCLPEDLGCQKACYYESVEYKNNSCWEVPEWQYCCEGTVTNKPCDSVVTTPECPNWCCGIKLNTYFPFIGNCIWDSSNENETNAFPTMVWAITKIVMSLILVVCFILIIYAGILWASNKPTDAKKWLTRVAVTILLLWFSWAILRLINPNFFS